MHPLLANTEHRPWPLPSGTWLMTQTWHDLLFAHWPVREESLRSLVPAQLSLDKFDGACWAGVIPFRMSGIRRRGMPPFPRLSQFPELNVRTYVVYEGKPGVYFFSLDAASRSAVWAARRFYHLPYFHAVMSCDASNGQVNYDSCRITGGAAFRGRYRPSGELRQSSPGTLEHWLTERYACTASSGGMSTAATSIMVHGPSRKRKPKSKSTRRQTSPGYHSLLGHRSYIFLDDLKYWSGRSSRPDSAWPQGLPAATRIIPLLIDGRSSHEFGRADRSGYRRLAGHRPGLRGETGCLGRHRRSGCTQSRKA